MIRHYLLISYRNFQRFRSSFLINLVGLSTGLACVLLIFLWVNDETSIDQFHEKGDRLYQVLENVDQGHGIITRFSTSGPMAEALATEFPEVEMAITSTWNWGQSAVLSVDDHDVKGTGIYADRNFFNMFSFELVQGDKDQVLNDKKNIVLTETMCVKLFGTTDNVLGKTVELQHKEQFQVAGVVKDFPRNFAASSARVFEYFLPFELFRDQNDWVRNWFNTAPQTHVLLKEGTDVVAFNDKIKDLVRTKTEKKASHRTPFVQLMRERYLHGRYENGILVGGRIEYVKMFSIIAGFILLIACINFMNLSTARASRRSKEVGIKKAVGARRSSLISQYLSESILMATISLVIALIFVVLLLPQFNAITEKNIALSFDVRFILALLGFVLLTGALAGSYPALYLSRFSPASVLKGKLSGAVGETWARKGLVMIQFTLSMVLIVCVLVVYQQINFIQTRNLGYNKDNVMIINRNEMDVATVEVFTKELKRLPGVLGVSSSGHDMTGHNGGTYGVQWEGKNPDDRTEFERFAVDYGLPELLNIEVKEGRLFSEDFKADTARIIFNEAAIAFMGMKDPIGKKVKLWDNDMEIVGVVKDFNFESFHEPVKPLFFYLNKEHAGSVMIKVDGGKEKETLAAMEEVYKSFNPGFPFEYRFIDDDYQQLYAAERRVATLSKYFAALAVVISCLGLFGLAAFTAERRMKEIGIRKILGSSNLNIVYLLSGEFTKMVVAAILIALPVSWYMASNWLEGFEFRIPLEWWYFAGSGVAALLIAWLTVGMQTIKASRVNPVQCIKTE